MKGMMLHLLEIVEARKVELDLGMNETQPWMAWFEG
jgi:hypothetical protein